jgi:t-SNARE complex subunit (syntaxin)
LGNIRNTEQALQETKTKLEKMHCIAIIIIIIIIIISCHMFSFFPGTSALESVVNPTTQASSLSL